MLDFLWSVFHVALFLSIVLPYMMYTWAYKFPRHFKNHWTQDQLVQRSASVKSVCFALYLILCLKSGFNLSAIPIAIPCIAAGQLLNYLVFQKLGKVRAYYGWELGLDRGAEQKGFPFNLGHAQYKGCLLSLLGTFFLFQTNVELTVVTGIWAFMYFYMIILESSPCGKI